MMLGACYDNDIINVCTVCHQYLKPLVKTAPLYNTLLPYPIVSGDVPLSTGTEHIHD